MEHLLSSIYLLCQYLENMIILDMNFPQQLHCLGVKQNLDIWAKLASKRSRIQVKIQATENANSSNEMMNNCLFSVFQVNCYLWGKLSSRIRTLNMKSTPVALIKIHTGKCKQEPLSSITTVLINLTNQKSGLMEFHIRNTRSFQSQCLA